QELECAALVPVDVGTDLDHLLAVGESDAVVPARGDMHGSTHALDLGGVIDHPEVYGKGETLVFHDDAVDRTEIPLELVHERVERGPCRGGLVVHLLHVCTFYLEAVVAGIVDAVETHAVAQVADGAAAHESDVGIGAGTQP